MQKKSYFILPYHNEGFLEYDVDFQRPSTDSYVCWLDHLDGTTPRRKTTEAVDQLNRHSLMNETIHNNAFVIQGYLVLKNGHLYTYKVLVLII